MSRRLRFTLSYDGSAYHGWQVQPGLATVQATLEKALSQIDGKPVNVAASGRTDAGVHALAQVAACDLDNPIPAPNLLKALNRLLPADIRILSAADAPPDFHPRFQAIAKTYEYRIWRGEVCPPFQRQFVYHHPYVFGDERFLAAAGVYQGIHNFSAFAAADEKDALGASKVREVYSSAAERSGDLLVYRVRGSGFLKHMVRNMVGGLMEVGRGNLSAGELAAFLAPGCGRKLGQSVPARGLFLMSVEYPPSPTPDSGS